MFSSLLKLIAASIALLLIPSVCAAQGQPADAKPPANKPAAATPAKPAQRPIELKALDRLTGIWLVDISSATMADTPDANVVEQKGRAVETMQWILDNSFVAGHSTGESGRPVSAYMWGYDQGTRTYRLWWFGAGGQVTEWAGAYDHSNRTFTLRTEAAGGYKSEATIQFVDDNTRKQIVQVRNPEGKPIQRITATMTRKK